LPLIVIWIACCAVEPSFQNRLLTSFTCGFGLRGQGKEAAVLAFWCAHFAHRAAVNAGGRHAGKKATIKARVPGLEGSVTGIVIESDCGGHGQIIRMHLLRC
jgi:hypothetical protein